MAMSSTICQYVERLLFFPHTTRIQCRIRVCLSNTLAATGKPKWLSAACLPSPLLSTTAANTCKLHAQRLC
eukprot:12908142-Prorocentrum_lima.AAC.1